MQDAKDTFYEVLRDRVAAGNAARTVVVRGVLRTGVVVQENEVSDRAELCDCFRLQWATLALDEQGPVLLVSMGCEIRYATKGAVGGLALDRGRALAAMDAELLVALQTKPQSAVKKSFAAMASGGAAVETGSRIWWGDVAFGPVVTVDTELQRTATVLVRSYEEAGGA